MILTCLPHSVRACVPASSFVSYWSAAGSGPRERLNAFATSRRPQPLSGVAQQARSVGQPFAAFTSSARVLEQRRDLAVRQRAGRRAKSIAAAAETCGAANDVPSGSRSRPSRSPSKPWSRHVGPQRVIASGSVEKMRSPGAEMSL